MGWWQSFIYSNTWRWCDRVATTQHKGHHREFQTPQHSSWLGVLGRWLRKHKYWWNLIAPPMVADTRRRDPETSEARSVFCACVVLWKWRNTSEPPSSSGQVHQVFANMNTPSAGNAPDVTTRMSKYLKLKQMSVNFSSWQPQWHAPCGVSPAVWWSLVSLL